MVIGFLIPTGLGVVLFAHAAAVNAPSVNLPAAWGPSTNFSSSNVNLTGLASPSLPYQCLTGKVIQVARQSKAAPKATEDEDLGYTDTKAKKISNSAFVGSAQNAMGLEVDCPEVTPVLSAPSCSSSSVKDKTGVFSLKATSSLIQDNAAAIEANICKINKANYVQQEVACLVEKGSSFQQFASSLASPLQSEVDENLRVQKGYRQALEELGQQQQEVQLKLSGNPAVGQDGLLQLKEKLARGQGDFNVRLENDSAVVSRAMSDLRKKVTEYNQQWSVSIMEETERCFRETPDPNMKCLGKGEQLGQTVSCSREQALLERIEQESLRGEDGQAKTRTANKKSAASTANLVKSQLARLFGDVPKTKGAATNPQAAEAYGGQTFNIMSKEELIATLNKRFSGISTPGINLLGFLNAAVSGCYSAAFKTVNSRTKQEGTPLANKKREIEETRRTSKQIAQTMLGQYTADIQNVARVLGAGHVAIPTKQCDSSLGYAEENCLNDLKKTLGSLVRGDDPQVSVTSMTFKGGTYVKNLTIPGAGIEGFISNLQQQTTNFIRTVNEVRSNQQEAARLAEERYTTKLKTIGQALSGPAGDAASIKTQLDKISKYLSGKDLRVSGGFRFKYISPVEAPQEVVGKTASGEPITIPGKSTNVMGLIAGQMQGTPLIDFGSSDLNGELSKVTEKAAELEKENQKIAKVSQEIEELKSECSLDRLKDKAKELEALGIKFKESCAWMEDKFGGTDRLKEFTSNMELVINDLPRDIADILRSGVSKVTGTSNARDLASIASSEKKVKDAEEEIRKLKSDLAALKSKNDASYGTKETNFQAIEKTWLTSKSELEVLSARLNNFKKSGDSSGWFVANEALKNADKAFYEATEGDKKNPEKVPRLQSDKTRAESVLNQLNAEYNELRSKVTAAEDAARRDQREYDFRKAAFDSANGKNLQDEIDRIEKEKEEKNADLRDLRANRDKTAEKKTTGESKMDDGDASCESISSSLIAKKDELKEAAARYRSTSSKAE